MVWYGRFYRDGRCGALARGSCVFCNNHNTMLERVLQLSFHRGGRPWQKEGARQLAERSPISDRLGGGGGLSNRRVNLRSSFGSVCECVRASEEQMVAGIISWGPANKIEKQRSYVTRLTYVKLTSLLVVQHPSALRSCLH